MISEQSKQVKKYLKRLIFYVRRLMNPLPSSYDTSLCKFLKTRTEVDACTAFLKKSGYVSHILTCKDWDLAHIIPEINNGNFLDMGSSDSYILKNISLKGIHGRKYGVDFREPEFPVKGVQYIKGNLLDTKLPDSHFRNITCLSVIEHGVDFTRFCGEVSRLLEIGGRVFITFDYWTPKLIPPIKMYDLPWQPLDDQALRELIEIGKRFNLHLIQDMDWTLGDPVIRYDYYSPHPDMNYTFGLVVLEKKLR